MKDPIAGYKNYVLLMAMAVTIFSYMDRVLVGILGPLIKSELGLSDTELGLLSGTAFAAAYIMMNIPIAWLSDRVRRVRVLSISLVIWSVATALFGFGEGLVFMLFARFIVGAAESGNGPATHSLLTDYFPLRQRARAYAVYGISVPLGAAAGAAVGVVAEGIGWRGTFILAGSLGVMTAIIFHSTVREPERGRYDVAKASPAGFITTIATLISKPTFLLLITGSSLLSIVTFSELFWIPSYFTRSFSLSIAEASMIFGIINVSGGIIGSWTGGYLADKLGHRSSSAYGLVPAYLVALSTLPLAFMFITQSLAVAIICYFLTILLVYGTAGPVVAAHQYISPPNMRATASAIHGSILIGVGLGLGVAFVGWLSDLLEPQFMEDSLKMTMLFALPILSAVAALFYGIAGYRLPDQMKIPD